MLFFKILMCAAERNPSKRISQIRFITKGMSGSAILLESLVIGSLSCQRDLIPCPSQCVKVFLPAFHQDAQGQFILDIFVLAFNRLGIIRNRKDVFR